MLEFYESVHRFEFDGRVLNGVTDTLRAVNLLRAWGTQDDLDRGAKVHRAIHIWFDKQLAHCPDWIEPYIEGVKNFVAETGFVPTGWEKKIHCPIHGFAGIMDVEGRMRGQRLRVVGDWKTGEVSNWTRYQLASYSLCKPCIRVAVSLSPGLRGGLNYDCQIYGVDSLMQDYQVFLAALRVARAIRP